MKVNRRRALRAIGWLVWADDCRTRARVRRARADAVGARTWYMIARTSLRLARLEFNQAGAFYG